MCDEMGIVVIDECPAVGLESFNDIVLTLHKMSLTELVCVLPNLVQIFLTERTIEMKTERYLTLSGVFSDCQGQKSSIGVHVVHRQRTQVG